MAKTYRRGVFAAAVFNLLKYSDNYALGFQPSMVERLSRS